MDSRLIAALVGTFFLLLVSSCATMPTEPLASGELRLLRIYVPQSQEIRLNFRFVVNIDFEANGKPEIRTACFYFSDDGPYCFKVTDVNYGSPGTIKVEIQAKASGSLSLESYVFYVQDAKVKPTNLVSSHIKIIP